MTPKLPIVGCYRSSVKRCIKKVPRSVPTLQVLCFLNRLEDSHASFPCCVRICLSGNCLGLFYILSSEQRELAKAGASVLTLFYCLSKSLCIKINRVCSVCYYFPHCSVSTPSSLIRWLKGCLVSLLLLSGSLVSSGEMLSCTLFE